MPITPLDFANDLLERAELLAARAGNPSDDAWSVDSDILRSAWTFVGAAIDTYFHERVRGALTSRPMSSAAAKYVVKLGAVESMIDRFIADRAKSRPRVILKNILHDELLGDTFQGSRNIEAAFNLLGVRRPWATLGDSMGDTAASIRNRLDRQYIRRNRIAHQGDYSRQERPRRIFFDSLVRSEVDAEVVWTKVFLSSADSTT